MGNGGCFDCLGLVFEMCWLDMELERGRVGRRST